MPKHVIMTFAVVMSIGLSPTLSRAESEPNDTCLNANPLGMGETVSGDLTASDVDWYIFELTDVLYV
jgi:hypothetical protein